MLSILNGLPGGAAWKATEIAFLGYQQEEAFRPLVRGERGIILWSGVEIRPDGLTLAGSPLDPQKLRAALLLHDRIDWPWNDMVADGSQLDHEFLMAEGIMRRSAFGIRHANNLTPILEINRCALAQAEKDDQGLWALGRTGFESPSLPVGALDNSGVLVRLKECIPVPAGDVPLVDILEFKQKRRDELANLHLHIERIYQSILAAPDRGRAEDAEFAALDRAIADHMKVIGESPFKKVLSGLDVNINLVTLGGAAVGSVTAFQLGLPISASLAASAAALSVDVGIGRKKQSETKNPFEYVTQMYTEL
mgnify:CR=1 FL=1